MIPSLYVCVFDGPEMAKRYVSMVLPVATLRRHYCGIGQRV
jgi:hypothetical protein